MVIACQKRKALTDEFGELKVKRKVLQTDAEVLYTSADDFSDKQRNCSSTNTSGKIKWNAISSKKESRTTEGTELPYR